MANITTTTGAVKCAAPRWGQDDEYTAIKESMMQRAMHVSQAINLAQEINAQFPQLRAKPLQYRIPYGYVRIEQQGMEGFKDCFSRESWYKYAESIGIPQARPKPAISYDIPETF